MSIKPIYITGLLCTLLLAGCSSTPYNRSKSPHFDGVLTFSGEPVGNAQILLSLASADALCLKAKRFTSTDEQGKFKLKAVIEKHTYVPFVNYQFSEWTLCANYNGDIVTLYSNNRYDSGSTTGSVYLECDFALRPINKPCMVSQDAIILK